MFRSIFESASCSHLETTPPVRSVSLKLRKPMPFRRCFLLPGATRVNSRCSLPPGAASTLLERIREEVCGPSNKPQRKPPPLRQFKPPHHRSCVTENLRRYAPSALLFATSRDCVPT